MIISQALGHQPSQKALSSRMDVPGSQLDSVEESTPTEFRETETPQATPGIPPHPEILAEDAPQSWEEEMKFIRKRFPGVTFDRVDFVGRECTMTIQRPKDLGGLIRVDIRFPIGYPGKISLAPSFEVQRTVTMSMADRTYISEVGLDEWVSS